MCERNHGLTGSRANYGMPVARLAAAQAAVEEKRKGAAPKAKKK